MQTKQAESSEMDHTPNKQSKTDPDDSPEGFTNPVAVHMHASQMDDLDPEFEWTNFGNQRTSQVKPQSHCQSYIYNSPKKESVTSLSSSFSTDFQLKRTTNSLTSSAHTVTPFGDNFSSYLKPKSMELSVAPVEERHNPLVSCLPSQPDSTLDFGYSSNSGHSSYQGQDNNSSQQDDPTVDQGSQLDLPMSQSVGWSNENCFENCLYGENELEDLLYRFRKYLLCFHMLILKKKMVIICHDFWHFSSVSPSVRKFYLLSPDNSYSFHHVMLKLGRQSVMSRISNIKHKWIIL